MARSFGVFLVFVLAFGGGCRKKEAAPPPATTTAIEQEKPDHEIGISNLRIATVKAEEYELTVDVHDPKGDLTPDQRAVAKYQIVCPGGAAHGVLSEPTKLSSKAGQTIATHRVSTQMVKKGTEPCHVKFAVGHRFDFLSNELEGTLSAR